MSRTTASIHARRFARAALVAALAPAFAAAQTYITNEAQVPGWSQIHDFRGTYNGRATNIETAPGSGTYVTYDNLAADARTFFPRAGTAMNPGGRLPVVRVNPANPRDKFVANDYYNTTGWAGWNLASGFWHCAPASTAMYIEWAKANILTRLDDRGGEFNSINDFANEADCNDYSFTIDTTANQMHFGTQRAPMIAAANRYADDSSIFYGATTFRAWNYTPAAYRQIVDRGDAVVLYYGNVDPVTMQQTSGHVVVGVGYDAGTQEIIVRDPWTRDGANTRRKNWNNITQLGGGGAGLYYGGGDDFPDNPPSADFNSDWDGARMALYEIPDYGDAPSSYMSDSNAEAGHLSGYREWLGASVSREVNAFQNTDDEDGVANVNNNDAHDDGVTFVNWTPGQISTVNVSISSIAGMSIDTDLGDQDMPAVLNINAWADWNQDSRWTPDEQIVDGSLAADFDGTQVLTFSFLVPGEATGEYWLRFRLDRGEDVGAYGFAQFGEVEDYLVPEPSTLVLLALGAIAARRRA
ncbi:MAG: GEVED domain-containing protein [Phycisphaerae bacterium]|nr:GEVED domain-containing protein [Phycisphaerae bacterium]